MSSLSPEILSKVRSAIAGYVKEYAQAIKPLNGDPESYDTKRTSFTVKFDRFLSSIGIGDYHDEYDSIMERLTKSLEKVEEKAIFSRR